MYIIYNYLMESCGEYTSPEDFLFCTLSIMQDEVRCFFFTHSYEQFKHHIEVSIILQFYSSSNVVNVSLLHEIWCVQMV